MSTKTKKVGPTGRFGARYGRGIKERVRKIEVKMKSKHKCPKCEKQAVKRKGYALWAEAREFIRVYSLSKHLELRIADFARRQLGDFLDGDRDWLIPLLNSMCALVESNYRDTLGLPKICDGLDILEEQATLQRNVLKGYKDPLQGVTFACRCKEDRN